MNQSSTDQLEPRKSRKRKGTLRRIPLIFRQCFMIFQRFFIVNLRSVASHAASKAEDLSRARCRLRKRFINEKVQRDPRKKPKSSKDVLICHLYCLLPMKSRPIFAFKCWGFAVASNLEITHIVFVGKWSIGTNVMIYDGLLRRFVERTLQFVNIRNFSKLICFNFFVLPAERSKIK